MCQALQAKHQMMTAIDQFYERDQCYDADEEVDACMQDPSQPDSQALKAGNTEILPEVLQEGVLLAVIKASVQPQPPTGFAAWFAAYKQVIKTCSNYKL